MAKNPIIFVRANSKIQRSLREIYKADDAINKPQDLDHPNQGKII